MLVISRKNGQKIMINDNIVITIVDSRNGQCKIAIDADKDVKIYREEIYYQIKLANLVGKNTSTTVVDSVSDLLKDNNVRLNNEVELNFSDSEVELDKNNNSKTFIIKKKDPDKE
ncbi:MAG: carbon storage regulator [Cyanobacteria bacterium SIG28]|nr:carbon storage regulator [Cyanobacteria bacterium SIG28]